MKFWLGRIGRAALAVAAMAAIGGSNPAAAQGSGSATLDAVKARGQLQCGIAGNVPGFSLPDSQGVMKGLDADSCRAVTAAVLGDVSKTKFVAPRHRTASPPCSRVRSTCCHAARPGRWAAKATWV